MSGQHMVMSAQLSAAGVMHVVTESNKLRSSARLAGRQKQQLPAPQWGVRAADTPCCRRTPYRVYAEGMAVL
jgi:hypothetical protein